MLKNLRVGTDQSKRRRRKQRKRIMTYGTWNVQDLFQKLNEIISKLKKTLSRYSSDHRNEKERNRFGKSGLLRLFSGVSRDQRAQQEVSILIRKTLRRYITAWEAIDQRIIKINLTIYGYKTAILGVNMG